jgi:hypothetical protein
MLGGFFAQHIAVHPRHRESHASLVAQSIFPKDCEVADANLVNMGKIVVQQLAGRTGSAPFRG